ncbi:MAG TPA: DUF3592 domain-containing protein [Aggregatilineales bacterium]|nr:DUF3592 domain-containing protein [Anaerolineales bacterium]HRE48456.1 DUF3592 domain-containing protein [Aggregatilineales bacterium]
MFQPYDTDKTEKPEAKEKPKVIMSSSPFEDSPKRKASPTVESLDWLGQLREKYEPTIEGQRSEQTKSASYGTDYSGSAADKVPPNAFFLVPKQASFPQTRKLTSSGGMALVVFGFIFMVALGGMWLYDTIRANARTTNGVTTTATVTSRTTSRGSKGGTTYYIHYQFRAGNERDITIKEAVNSSLYSRVSNGSTLQVRYAKDDPYNAHLVENSYTNGMVIAGIVGFLVGVPMFFGGIVTFRRHKRLERRGMVLAGRLTQIRGSSSKSGYTVTAKYTAQTPDGQTLKGSSSANRNDLRKQSFPPVGTAVVVVWDGNKAHRML